MRKIEIWQSQMAAPTSTNALWLVGNNLKIFGNKGWEDINSSQSLNTPTEATVDKAGLVKKATRENQLNKDATLNDIINKLNAVIVKLQAAGIMA